MATEYFAAKDPEELSGILLDRAKSWFMELEDNRYLDKVKACWMAYYGMQSNNISGESHKITFSGEQGELVNVPVNHFRNLARHIITMITTNRPALQAKAVNTDYKTLVQTTLANGLLDYYMREKRIEKKLKKTCSSAVVMGSGYIKMAWNATSGEEYDKHPETGAPIYEGDIEIKNLSPFDVVYDGTKENSEDNEWVLCRSWANKFNLSAKFPEKSEDLEQLETKSDSLLRKFKLNLGSYDQTDDVPVFEFYHKKTEAMPFGRYMLFTDNNIVLYDGEMPYRRLPVYRMVPDDIMGTPYGYSDMFDILPLQELINSLYSTIASNQNAFGVQNIYVPKGANINIRNLAGGLNVIEGNGGKDMAPVPLNLTHTPEEIFKFLQMIESTMETISGVNSVARGEPQASLKSGNALALIQSMALQFMSGLQQSYVELMEDVGTGMIEMLQDFASVPRVATIVGETNHSYMEEFSGDDLSQIRRVSVEVANPLSKTTAGRVQMAEQLLQMGLITSIEQYATIINTGQLNSMTEGIHKENILIKSENQRMIKRQPIRALALDNHDLHIREHKMVLNDSTIRDDLALSQSILDHIQEHIDLLRSVDPDLLMIIQEQPLSPVGGTPAGQNPQQANQQGMGGVPETMQQPPTGQNAQELGINLPQPAQPPKEFASMLPTTPEDMI